MSPTDPPLTTYTGLRMDFAAIDSSPIAVADIAHALSQICRFGGHTAQHYSVAEHSISVAILVERWARDAGAPLERVRQVFLAALTHDAAEAYVGDMTLPVKLWLRRTTDAYDRLEAEVQRRIERELGIEVDEETRALVKRADLEMASIEMTNHLPPLADGTEQSMDAHTACMVWIAAYHQASHRRGRFASLSAL